MPATFELSVRCGDCIFFERHKHTDYDLPCKQEGKITTTSPCRHFSADGRGVKRDLMIELLRLFPQFLPPPRPTKRTAPAKKQNPRWQQRGFFVF